MEEPGQKAFQQLLEPQPWGDFPMAQTGQVEIMAPPLSVLKQAFATSTHNEVCYIVVTPGRSRKIERRIKSKKRLKKPNQKTLASKEQPKYRLIREEDDDDTVIYNIRDSSMHDSASSLSSDSYSSLSTFATLDIALEVLDASRRTAKKSLSDETETTADVSHTDDVDEIARRVSPRCGEHSSDQHQGLSSCGSKQRKRNLTELATPSRTKPKATSDNNSIVSSGLNNSNAFDLLRRLAECEKREKRLQKQLRQSGLAPAEDIPYALAKQRIQDIAKRMNTIGGNDVSCKDKKEQAILREEYFKLEQEMERYNAALMLTDEWQEEQDAIERKWEDDNEAANLEALYKIRRHMPVMIRHMTTDELSTKPTPNGKFLPVAIITKFKRTNVLQLLRMNPADIERMHPSSLESLRVTGLMLTERRALYAHLKPIGDKWRALKNDKMTERKWKWFQMMKNNFKESLGSYQRHVQQYGSPNDHHPRSKDHPSGCPLVGRQCPIVADMIIDYSGDYGFTEKGVFEVSQIHKSLLNEAVEEPAQSSKEQEREKRSHERTIALKQHYIGKLAQVSKANGSCEAMDEIMDKVERCLYKWIAHDLRNPNNNSKQLMAEFMDTLSGLKLSTIDFALLAGLQISGSKKSTDDSCSDPRSALEAGLSEEVYELIVECFSYIESRVDSLGAKDSRLTSTICSINKLWDELHCRNLATLERLGVGRPERTRRHLTCAAIKAELITSNNSNDD